MEYEGRFTVLLPLRIPEAPPMRKAHKIPRPPPLIRMGQVVLTRTRIDLNQTEMRSLASPSFTLWFSRMKIPE